MKKKTREQRNWKDAVLCKYEDLWRDRVVHNRTTLRRWMNRKENPFPAPIILTVSARQNASIAWRVADVLAWIDRRDAALNREAVA